MKCYVAHYRNKYPKGRVDFSETHLDAFDSKGDLRVALRVGGGGVILDKGDDLGATDSHDLSPIPKNTRVHKFFEDGRLGLDDQAESRKIDAQEIADHYNGKVPSIAELKKAGADFDGEILRMESF